MVEKRKFKWWLLVIPVLLFFAVLTAVFWDAIWLRVAPKAVLTSALTKAFSQLEERFREDPLLIVARSADPEGKYTADLTLETERELLGKVTYDMTVQTDGVSHQLLAKGLAKTADKELDLSVYMDSGFMAVSSEDLVKGNYYGITYETFASDLRKIPLLNFMVSDSLLAQWDASVQNIQEQMSRTYALPALPEISQEDTRKLLLGVAAMPCEIEKCSVLLDGNAVTCHKLDYRVSGEQVGNILSQATNRDYPSDTSVTVSFYLYQNCVIKLMLSCEAGESAVSYSLSLGMNPGEDTLLLQEIDSSDGQFKELITSVSTQRSESSYEETWNIRKTEEGNSSAVSVSFEWNPTSGDMVLQSGGAAVSLNLTETENGFCLVTDDFVQLIKIATQSVSTSTGSGKIPCTMTITKGSEISVPAYKNLDQWSLEDFLVLLGGIGSLLGIHIG